MFCHGVDLYNASFTLSVYRNWSLYNWQNCPAAEPRPNMEDSESLGLRLILPRSENLMWLEFSLKQRPTAVWELMVKKCNQMLTWQVILPGCSPYIGLNRCLQVGSVFLCHVVAISETTHADWIVRPLVSFALGCSNPFLGYHILIVLICVSYHHN